MRIHPIKLSVRIKYNCIQSKYNLIKLRREPRIFWDVTVLVCDSIFRKERFYPSGVERFPYR